MVGNKTKELLNKLVFLVPEVKDLIFTNNIGNLIDIATTHTTFIPVILALQDKITNVDFTASFTLATKDKSSIYLSFDIVDETHVCILLTNGVPDENVQILYKEKYGFKT